MREQITPITRDGLVSIPPEVRQALNLKEGDLVSWIIEDGHVELRKGESVVARTAGALKSNRPLSTIEEETEAAEQAIVEDAMRQTES